MFIIQSPFVKVLSLNFVPNSWMPLLAQERETTFRMEDLINETERFLYDGGNLAHILRDRRYSGREC